ncbi:penicillin-binding transpeptidase domain-containing protein [Lachnospiraceae bacterium OttesenSCG-928-J05]|nr:penicillin-binding transpeptidase domain-containing protein [Lachnospiraceae bacterium OttesenSCG-928-J05]
MKSKRKHIILILSALLIVLLIVGGILAVQKFHLFGNPAEQKKQVLKAYMTAIEKNDYEKMWSLLSKDSQKQVSKEDFISRNQNIYEGIGTTKVTISELSLADDEDVLSYHTTLLTSANEIAFDNQVDLVKEDNDYKIKWTDSLIFPELTADDKVQIAAEEAPRGDIRDRNGALLATQGEVSEVGFVPGKMNKDNKEGMQKVADLLEIPVTSIEDKLSASWVNDDSFVPIKKIKKYQGDYEHALASGDADALFHQQLLEVPGVLINTVTERIYPLGESAALLTGYVQKVTAEDLEKHAGEGYGQNSYIGKSGLEYLYEEQLKGEDGCKIWIANKDGDEKQVLASKLIVPAESITTTIDANLQRQIYNSFASDKAASVAMNPYTGEVLALVSTPSYDVNLMVLGLSEAKWNALNDDPNKPMFNRFRATWVPGSTMKPITGAIGVNSGKLDPGADLGHSGLSWQKDSSWGNFSITTLVEYSGAANLSNGLIFSDNIYFAKAAMQIGKDDFTKGLDNLGFDKELDFPIKMETSSYGILSTETDLANSGYGQAQMLVNPLHMATIYSAFLNSGIMVKPVLDSSQKQSQTWLENAFSPEVAELIKSNLANVISENSSAVINTHGATFAGKTGTAEIKTSQSDTSGTELGWFNIFTIDRDHTNALLMVSMVEDVKDRGGSSYVVNKTDKVLANYMQ